MSGLEYDDLFQEGYVTYCTVLPKYDPVRGTLNTFLKSVLRKHYTNLYHVMKWGVRVVDKNVVPEELYWQPTYLHELLSFDYSEQAKNMLNIIVESSPKSLVTPNQFALKRFLKEGGFEASMLDRTIEELVFKVYRDLKGLGVKLTFN